MAKKNYLILIFISLTTICFGQIPIGKDIKIGVNEVKSFFKQKGLHLIKEENKTQKWGEKIDNYVFLSYKEEMGIMLYKNEYENIKEVDYYTDNIEMRNKLYKYLQKDKWAFISKNDIGQETYTYKGFDIQLLFFTDDYNHTEIRIKK